MGLNPLGLDPLVGEFLARLVRLDPQALVRIRSNRTSAVPATELWARLPWNVLVMRPISSVTGDCTVSAKAWLSSGRDDPSQLAHLDAQWRVGMPPSAVSVRETLSADVLRGVSEAAAETLRETAVAGLNGRAVGARMLRDALLDHIPIVVAADAVYPNELRVPQRLVQAVARMGFLGEKADQARILEAGDWIGISTGLGDAWWRGRSALSLNAHRA